jgi:hypothetical protein
MKWTTGRREDSGNEKIERERGREEDGGLREEMERGNRRKQVIKEGIVMKGRAWGPEGRRKLSRGGPDKSKKKVCLRQEWWDSAG